MATGQNVGVRLPEPDKYIGQPRATGPGLTWDQVIGSACITDQVPIVVDNRLAGQSECASARAKAVVACDMRHESLRMSGAVELKNIAAAAPLPDYQVG